MCDPEQWPPADPIIPLLVSIHISPDRPVTNAWFHPASRDYLRRFGPVGARDTDTLAMLREHDIPAYFSGCLTLTLKRNGQAAREDYVCAVDVGQQVLIHLRRHTDRPVIPVTHWVPPYLESKDTYVLAEMLLDLYQRAHCVVTSRLHVALPCLALQTPVLLLHETDDSSRFSGLNELIRHCLARDYLDGSYQFDLDNPGENRQEYLAFREGLVERCCAFIGPAGREAYAAAAVPVFAGLPVFIPIWEKQKSFERALRELKSGRVGLFGAYLIAQAREFFGKYEQSRRKRH